MNSRLPQRRVPSFRSIALLIPDAPTSLLSLEGNLWRARDRVSLIPGWLARCSVNTCPVNDYVSPSEKGWQWLPSLPLDFSDLLYSSPCFLNSRRPHLSLEPQLLPPLLLPLVHKR